MTDRVETILRVLSGADDIRFLVRKVRWFDRMFSEKVFPPFDNPQAQADLVAQEYWNRRMGEPVGEDDDVDPGGIADDANAKGQSFYDTLQAMHNTVLNLFTAGLYHVFEQQAGTVHKLWFGTASKSPVGALRDWLNSELRIDVTGAPTWSVVWTELRRRTSAGEPRVFPASRDQRAWIPGHPDR